MVNDIEFCNINNDFQKKLKNGINEIKICKILVSAGKSRNLCKLEKDQYERLFRENITKTYKKSSNKKIEKINYIAKQTVPMLEDTEACITIKGHKSEFPNKILYHLIIPSK